VLPSARRWTRMIFDGRGGVEVRCREAYQDRCPEEFKESESSVCELPR
jgi:hypothetical protein